MSQQNTLYIAEPIFSELLQKFDSETTFPPIKKIGITTGSPQKRERELLGTVSPVKISIVKAWTNIDAKRVESMLHTILDNSRLDGEYFWDGNETLLDAVSDFIKVYHPEAEELKIKDDSDVVAATESIQKKSSQRLYTEVVPKLEQLGIKYNITKNGKGIWFNLNDYRLSISSLSGGRYTLTIFSKTKSTNEALKNFSGSQELASHSSEDSNRRARIPMSSLNNIFKSIDNYIKNK
ncbi:MAG: GIY-YIG nuclease family protein [Candidatus Marinimicrobia bacterium]|nr:GIY-YIG nuclease family protein [Candidatus Neomarinimicrobiota bacterium]